MMKTIPLAMAASLLSAGPGLAQDATTIPIEELGWLAGSWSSEADDGWAEEHWTAPKGNIMLGVGRSGAGDTARSFEFLRIEVQADGTPVYIAAPGGGKATAFRLTGSDGKSAVFENAEHDFPQRIRYWREGDTLYAEISAIDGSNAMGWSLTLVD